jgi:hypothetical protein
VYVNDPSLFSVRAPFDVLVICIAFSVSPSMSVSLFNITGAAILRVVSSSMVYVSSFAVGGSFMGLIVMFTVAVFDVAPLLSFTVYVNVSCPL